MYTANTHSWKKAYACYLYVCLSGKLIKKGFGLNELLNIHNSAKVVNVKEPEAGMWTVKVWLFYKAYLFCFNVGSLESVYNVYTLSCNTRMLLLKNSMHNTFVKVSWSLEFGSVKFWWPWKADLNLSDSFLVIKPVDWLFLSISFSPNNQRWSWLRTMVRGIGSSMGVPGWESLCCHLKASFPRAVKFSVPCFPPPNVGMKIIFYFIEWC